jgi:hypothetical protein
MLRSRSTPWLVGLAAFEKWFWMYVLTGWFLDVLIHTNRTQFNPGSNILMLNTAVSCKQQ